MRNPKKPELHQAALKERHAATYIGMSASYLRTDRMNGHRIGRTPGPPFIRINRTIRYLKADLDSWLQEHRVNRQFDPETNKKMD